MTQILTANTGGFPRIGENKDEQRHRRGMAHWLRKEISSHAFRDVEQSVIQEVMREQIDLGLDEITDGLISWPDPISFLCQNLTGIKLTSLNRYFDQNFYYRLPVILTRSKTAKPTYLPFYQFAAAHSTVPVRTILTGPLTLARCTVSHAAAFKKLSARVELFADLLAAEISQLVQNGAKIIQIDEPSLTFYPEDASFLKKTIDQLVRNKPSARFILSIGTGPIAPLYDALVTLPVDVLNLDMTFDGKKLLEKISAKPPVAALGFGLVDAKTPKVEEPELFGAVKNWVENNNAPLVYLTPSSPLDQLPRADAVAKLRQLSELKMSLTS